MNEQAQIDFKDVAGWPREDYIKLETETCAYPSLRLSPIISWNKMISTYSAYLLSTDAFKHRREQQSLLCKSYSKHVINMLKSGKVILPDIKESFFLQFKARV